MVELRFRMGYGSSIAACFLIAGSTLASSAIAQTQTEVLQSSQLEEIVVTARKREELLQNVPVSIAAFSASDLGKRSLQNLDDVGQFLPNLTVSQAGTNGNSGALIYIRGIGQSDVLSTYDPAVGIYVDGVYLGRMQGNDIGTMDVERVEVLRGPQGTLFGKNTDGGAISIITRQPDASADAPHGHVEVTTGEFHRFDVTGGINIPLVTDKAALELSGTRLSQDGYGNRADGQEMQNRNRDIGRMTLLLKPTDDFSAVLRADVTTYDEKNSSFHLVSVNTAAPVTGGLNAYLGAIGQPLLDGRWVTTDPYFNYGTGPNYSTGSLFGTSLTLNWDEDWGSLKSISAYRKNIVRQGFDVDGTPIGEMDSYTLVYQDQFSEELQVSGKSFESRLKWVGGLYFFGENVHDSQAFNLGAVNTAFTAITGAPFDANFDQLLNVRNLSYAAYGQATYAVTEKFNVTLGLRETYDQKFVGRDNLSFPGPSGDFFAYDGTLIQPYVQKNGNWSAASPRLSFDYQWTPDVMTYISASQGFKSGGFNGRASTVAEFNEYQPEKVWAYEIGLRSDWLDKKLRANLTAFYSDYRDLQVQDNLSVIVDGKPVPMTILDNVPRSRITGGEAELIVVPLPGLKLSGSLGLIDAKYTELSPGSSLTTSLQFPFTPKVSYTTGAEYSLPVSSSYDVTGRVDYAHKSTINYDLLNAPTLRQPGYGLLNARLTVDMLTTGLSLSVFGTNLTGTQYFTSGNDDTNSAFGWAFVNEAPPREWGVSAKYKF
jgi:iron complex outermembrane recepter protein